MVTRLEKYRKDGAFIGKYDGPDRGEIEESFERSLAQIYARADTPRLSGVQIKAPMYLNGKDDNLRRAYFRALATTAGLRAADADAAIDDLVHRLRSAIDRIALPKAMEFADNARKMVAEALDICRRRMEGMT